MPRSISSTRFVCREFPYSVYLDASIPQNILIPGHASYQTSIQSEFTVLTWVKYRVKPAALPSSSTIMASAVTSVNQNFALSLDSANGVVQALISNKVSTQTIQSTVKINPMAWSLVGMTFTAGSQLSVITNNTIKSAASTISANAVVQSTYIAMTNTFAMNANVCETMILDGIITQAELNNYYYNAVYPSLTKKLHYAYTVGSGTTISDISGSGNNGTIQGGGAWQTDTPFHVRQISSRGKSSISGINYKGIVSSTNESKNYVDIPTLTSNPSNSDWALFMEFYPPDDIHTAAWYNITLYAQNDGSGTGRSWLTIPLAAPNKGMISTAIGNGTTRPSGIMVTPSKKNTVVLNYTLSTQTLSFIVNGSQAQSYPGIPIETCVGAHRVGATKDDPVLLHGTRCFPNIIGRVSFYYGRTLSVSEALSMHDGNTDLISSSSCVLKYGMEQKSGNLIDDSGAGNVGIIKVYDPVTGNEAEWISNYVVPERTLVS